MPQMTQKTQMDKCLKVANQASYAFFNRFHYYFYLEAEEVKAEAHLAMVEAMLSYDPERERKLTSWVVFIVKRQLRKKFLKGMKMHQVHLEDFDELISDKCDLERSIMIGEAIRNLSPLSKEIVEILFKGKMKTKNDKKNTIKGEIRRILRERGYGIQRIKKAFHELKMLTAMPSY